MRRVHKRRSAQTRGRRAEWLAALFLRLKGYRILTHRAKSPVGEVDLIARKRKTIIFVEVKWRKDLNTALQAITPRGQVRIARAAQAWMARHPQYLAFEQRFDGIALAPWRWPAHVKSAFEAKLD